MTSSSPANDENMTKSPPPLMEEGKGGGEQLELISPSPQSSPTRGEEVFSTNPNGWIIRHR